ncbi:MAG TPA: ethanolamine utilization protein EutJ [Anaerovoracaceae bacterium]|nr:ethanolamine utilization protein EutJ [Anaerovoracaceae bacterium]
MLSYCNHIVSEFEKKLSLIEPYREKKKLYTGVDLGTAYIVLAVIDEEGNPVAGAYEYAEVVRDGVVFDFMGACRIVKKLKEALEEKLETVLEPAAVAYPPGVNQAEVRSIKYVAESAGFEVVGFIDEPTAANQVLKIENGAVADVGGGTTGVAVFKEGKAVYTADEATGGTQMTLVIAGALRKDFAEAEAIKKDADRQSELLPVIRPVMEKIATIIGRHIEGKEIESVILVGGTCCNPYIERVIGDVLNIQVLKPQNPFLVTPLGIAFIARNADIDSAAAATAED